MTTKKKILTGGLTLITTTIIVMGLFDFFKPKTNSGLKIPVFDNTQTVSGYIRKTKSK